MKKIALVFVTVVFVPSLLLAWLAVHFLRDQQLILERQQFLLYQGVADNLARQAEDYLARQQHDFGEKVEVLLANRDPRSLAAEFDDRLRAVWDSAEVGYVVTMNGDILAPPPASRVACTTFWADFGKFLGNRESAEVYVNNSINSKNLLNNGGFNNAPAQTAEPDNNVNGDNSLRQAGLSKAPVQNFRSVVPQQQLAAPAQNPNFLSKVSSSEAEFRQLVGDSTEGTVARFVENKLKVLVWHRSAHDSNLVFGAQLSLGRLKEGLRPVVEQVEPDIAVALLDDAAKPIAVSEPGFVGNWKHPFVATEIGESLPHWELAVYLLDPAKLARSAHALKWTFGLLTALLLVAIGIGGWFIVADYHREMILARKKTDFVSNVSHELKTPLTSIRMFSELLAEGRVTEPGKRQSYLNIITAETSRLTRLINNVLDFSRMERGEKKYNFLPCDLAEIVRETVETYRPHLESHGFKVEAHWPDGEIGINADRDAIAQVAVNLLSNAEKYSNGAKEITVEVQKMNEPLPHAEVRVLDRGSGVPHGFEEKIFEQFFRAHDSLSSGIQGSGLGLTLARQIARAHGGNVVYQPRAGGGSCFVLGLPVSGPSAKRDS